MIISNQHLNYWVQNILVFFCIYLFLGSYSVAEDNFPILPLSPVNSYVCQDNDYALCSHARCKCLNENGDEGECKEYKYNPNEQSSENRDIGWSSCECPKIIQSKLDKIPAYKANFASLDCAELENPSTNGTAFPSYVGHQSADVYSTYSFGDSLPGDIFKTKNSAKFQLCDTQPLMALCLDMPCKTELKDGEEVTTCYCQNIPLTSCDSGAWNTLGAECKTDKCYPGENQVWSAACVTKTLGGVSDLFVYIRKNLDKEFTDIPAFCSK
jgi:hypothetical protein